MKKYVITGSIGHISKVIVKELVKAGKEVKVITSSASRVKEIEALGADALLGQVQDAVFINEAFKGADVVYTMIPPNWQTTNWRKSQQEVAAIFTESIKNNQVKYVVNLSSIGADLETGTGPILGLHDFEQLLNSITDLNVKHLRPSYFFYNFLNQIDLIKYLGIIGSNFGQGEKVFLVYTNDIAKEALVEFIFVIYDGKNI